MRQEARKKEKIIAGVFLLFLFLSVGIAAPLHARAASVGDLVPCTNTLKPVTEGENKGGFTVEKPCSACTIFTLSQKVLNFIYWDISVPIATVMLLWAGFLMVISGLTGSPGSYQKGKDIITRTLIGICIVFFAWLAIDTLIKVVAGRVSLTSGTPATLPKAETSPGAFGPWNEVKCTEPAPIVFAPPAKQSPPTSSGGGGGLPPPNGWDGSQCDSTNSACSVQALQNLKYNNRQYTPAQANTMSCIAFYESGGAAIINRQTGDACGVFQILKSNWAKPDLHQGNCTSNTPCYNLECNTQAAFLMSQKQIDNRRSPYSDWTCDGCDPKGTKQACVNKYDPAWAR